MASPTSQTAFSGALTAPDAAVPAGLVAARHKPDGGTAKRFAVYRNNVVVSLVDALSARFPAVQAVVGEAFFRAMAGEFVRAHPPESPIMLFYGDALPDFLTAFPPAAGLPYLTDLARLEALFAHAAHAEDAEPAALADLAALPPETLGGARLTLHPSARLIASRHPIVSLHADNVRDEDVAVDLKEAQAALVVRPRFDVALHRLEPGLYAFAAALAAGQTLGTAASKGGHHDGFDLSGALAGLFDAGAIAAITPAAAAD